MRRLVRESVEMQDLGMGAFALRTPGTGDRFPGTPETVKEYVSRYHRFLELGILIGSGPVGMLSKLREIGWESGLGVVDGENSGMAGVRPLIAREEASHRAYAKLQGGDWFRCVETETTS